MGCCVPLAIALGTVGMLSPAGAPGRMPLTLRCDGLGALTARCFSAFPMPLTGKQSYECTQGGACMSCMVNTWSTHGQRSTHPPGGLPLPPLTCCIASPQSQWPMQAPTWQLSVVLRC